MHRRIGLTFVVATVAAVLLSTGAGCRRSQGTGPLVLRAADVHPETYPTTQGLLKMAEIVKERSGGRIQIQVYPAGQLGDEKETIESTQLGTIQINRTSTSPLAESVPAMKILGLPYLFRDAEHQWNTLHGPIGDELLEALPAAGLVGLTYYDGGARSFYNNTRPVHTPSDLEGLKIRTQQSEVMIATVKALGASPTPMAFSEVYSALQTGVIDGAENNPPSYWSTRHFEVARYYTLDGHSRVPEIVIIGKQTWDSLSPDDRMLLREAAEESAVHQRRLWREYEEEKLAAVRDEGADILEPDTAPFREAAAAVVEQHGRGFEDLIRRIREVE
jgi:tripartite ATP-independent transporter DctP family solute receptor